MWLNRGWVYKIKINEKEIKGKMGLANGIPFNSGKLWGGTLVNNTEV